ncbi:MAG: hypothetical protein KatS3mg105_3041 [Gemmatales bacterium]|nr:MAG: hypothetical protein KatS3mg105_3041 [Gemmatales bacterium]
MFRRLHLLMFMVLLLAAFSFTWAADSESSGHWMVKLLNRGRMESFWLLKLEEKDGKIIGSAVESTEGVPPLAGVKDVVKKNDTLSCKLVIRAGGAMRDLDFEGKLDKATGQYLGTISFGAQLLLAELHPTKATSLSKLDRNKEIVLSGKTPEIFSAALELLEQAQDQKAKVEDVRAWAAKAFSAAAKYGPRWQQRYTTQIAGVLVEQKEFAPVALEYARRAQRLLDPKDDYFTHAQVLTMLSQALEATGKPEEAKKVVDELDALYLKKMPPFKPEKYAGRKNKKGQAVLLELFTGTMCPPCVAADLAFDALSKSYSPSEVVLLQYHLHVPGPDPLTNNDTEARARYYNDEVEGTPTVIFNGKLQPQTAGGGSFDAAEEKYKIYRTKIDPLLEADARAKLTVSAQRKGDKISIAAEAADVDVAGDKVKLRVALVEDVVRFAGRNGIRFHHHVVRAFPGGVDGVVVKNKSARQTATVDLAELRKSLNNYLDEKEKAYTKQGFPFPKERPLDLKNLHVVAFVQNDETKEVLHAVQVPVESESE